MNFQKKIQCQLLLVKGPRRRSRTKPLIQLFVLAQRMISKSFRNWCPMVMILRILYSVIILFSHTDTYTNHTKPNVTLSSSIYPLSKELMGASELFGTLMHSGKYKSPEAAVPAMIAQGVTDAIVPAADAKR